VYLIVIGLVVGKDFADVVDQSLYLVDVPWLLLFHH
jgi:hypothetical protein